MVSCSVITVFKLLVILEQSAHVILFHSILKCLWYHGLE